MSFSLLFLLLSFHSVLSASPPLLACSGAESRFPCELRREQRLLLLLPMYLLLFFIPVELARVAGRRGPAEVSVPLSAPGSGGAALNEGDGGDAGL